MDLAQFLMSGGSPLSASQEAEGFSLIHSAANVWQTVCNLSGMMAITSISPRLSPRSSGDPEPLTVRVRVTVDGVVKIDKTYEQYGTTSTQYKTWQILGVPILAKSSVKIESFTNSNKAPNRAATSASITRLEVFEL